MATSIRTALDKLGITPSRVPAHLVQAPGFARLAEAVGRGDIAVPPFLLHGQRRRSHIRNTVLEDHRARMHLVPDAVEGKLHDLAADPFIFFRGTALLYHRDLVGSDSHLQTVPSIGDVHPENFGILPGADGRPLFSANDFDEAWPAPFTWDVNRGAVGFALQARSNQLPPKKQRKVSRDFIRGYIAGVEECLDAPGAAHTSITEGNAPACLGPFFTKAGRTRRKFLRKRIDLRTCSFLTTDKITPRSELVEVLRPVVAAYAAEVPPKFRPKNFFDVLDVAVRTGSGTASRGLPRFWALVEGWGPSAEEKVIIEFKLSRNSMLEGLVTENPDSSLSHADRTAMAFRAFVEDGDPLYGSASIGELSFLARERSPMKVNVDAGTFDYRELRAYARICGVQTAHLHARGDVAIRGTAGGEDTDRSPAMEEISRQVHATVFEADCLEFVDETVQRILDDHRLFREDLDRGAFDTIGGVGG
ncbi:MAG: DUF2252 family protein [Mycobacteriaceae bacterium]|uniref:DUF2252 family protein n=1 Tax=Corynebacterium sp. TaxID=1720 RepID=UPI003F987279